MVAYLMLFLLVACGSGSTVSLPQTKTAKIRFTATNGNLSANVTSLQISATLPTGVSVALNPKLPGDLLYTIAAGSFTSNITVNGVNAYVTGTYNDTSKVIALTVIPQLPATDFGRTNIGAFAEVSLSCQSFITSADFTNANPNLAGSFIVKGVDSTGLSIDPLTGLTPSMSVTF